VRNPVKRAALVVAHPDDETLWAGGTILVNRSWRWTVVALTRASDPDRAPKFRRAMERLGAEGAMADLDDGPEQRPLDPREVEEAVLATLPAAEYDLVFTHGPRGEYTRHLRHEETSRAVQALWTSGRLVARELRMFAYDDAGGARLPEAVKDAHELAALPGEVHLAKRGIVTGVYGFAADSWEARATPRAEGFWRFRSPAELAQWKGPGSR
jgi:LmbE family N-acetylglucosaminyl deacetylase